MSKTGESAIVSCSARYFSVPRRTVHPASIPMTIAGFLVDVKADKAQNKNVWSLKSFFPSLFITLSETIISHPVVCSFFMAVDLYLSLPTFVCYACCRMSIP